MTIAVNLEHLLTDIGALWRGHACEHYESADQMRADVERLARHSDEPKAPNYCSECGVPIHHKHAIDCSRRVAAEPAAELGVHPDLRADTKPCCRLCGGDHWVGAHDRPALNRTAPHE